MSKPKNLIKEIECFEPSSEQEEMDKNLFLRALKENKDVLTRKNEVLHCTASAMVVDEDVKQALFVYHLLYKSWIYPGGHADGESDLLAVAKREVEEETGLSVIPLNDGKIFTLQALPVESHIRHGKYVSAHTHYDVLYLFVAKNEDKGKIRKLESENSAVKWIDIKDIDNIDCEGWFKPVFTKVQQKLKVQTKMKKLVLSGSASCQKELLELKSALDKSYEIIDYPRSISKDEFMSIYPIRHKEFYQALDVCDLFILCNFDKNGVSGYVGAAGFAEMAYIVNRKLNGANVEIYIFKEPSSQAQSYDEIQLWLKLGWIKLWNN